MLEKRLLSSQPRGLLLPHEPQQAVREVLLHLALLVPPGLARELGEEVVGVLRLLQKAATRQEGGKQILAQIL